MTLIERNKVARLLVDDATAQARWRASATHLTRWETKFLMRLRSIRNAVALTDLQTELLGKIELRMADIGRVKELHFIVDTHPLGV